MVGDWISAQAKTHQVIWPQGWAFYSRTDTASFVVLYQPDQSGRQAAVTHQAADPEHLWGLRRVVNGEVIELAAVGALVPRERWRPCGGADIDTCRPPLDGNPPTRITAPLRVITACGQALLARERPAPWGSGTSRLISEVASVELTCPR
ncbi:hypothetical protein [Alloactinosynnema sp. L-07]|uniref:hypothetical protein n=1 Tax=Alloactinosynnema sp. L-07 TaxID=1653480 RepID=UPI001E3586DA|nr:hypothetical protein [Alloactinosynnema sp. L-07]